MGVAFLGGANGAVLIGTSGGIWVIVSGSDSDSNIGKNEAASGISVEGVMTMFVEATRPIPWDPDTAARSTQLFPHTSGVFPT